MPQIDAVTISGHIIYFLDPSITPIDVEDLRIHTSNICRYNGALKWPLIKHLALCTKLAENKTATHMQRYNTPTEDDERYLQTAFCSTHDFQEIYCTDVISGLKKYLADYREIENNWEKHVHQQLGLDLKLRNNEFVTFVDRRALVVEMTLLEHPAATLVAERYGGNVSGTERLVFDRIKNLSLDECWNLVWQSYRRGKNTLTENKTYTVEIF